MITFIKANMAYITDSETVCLSCQDTIRGIAYADADDISKFYCEFCQTEIEQFQLLDEPRY